MPDLRLVIQRHIRGMAVSNAVLPAEHRLAATRVIRDLGALPPDAILYLLAQPLLDLASDHLMHDHDLTSRYEERFEVEDREEWTVVMAEYNHEADAITAALFRAQATSQAHDCFKFTPPSIRESATQARSAVEA